MVKELIDLLKSTGNMEQVALDNYVPKNGLYFRIYSDGTIEEPLYVNKKEINKSEQYNWFVKADYYSQLVDMQKPVDPKKKIHSNNQYSLFIKCSILPRVGDLSKANETKVLSVNGLREAVQRYYDSLIQEKRDKVGIEILENCNVQQMNREQAEKNRDVILINLDIILAKVEKAISDGIGFTNKEYVKIFFDAPIEEYKMEYKRYTMPKLFNCNTYNISLNGEIYGLSNDNMGLNAKKPFLEHKTMHTKVPFRLSLDDALVSKRIFDWMNNLTDENGRILNEVFFPFDYNFKTSLPKVSGMGLYIYKEQDNGKPVIKDFDVIAHKVKLKRPLSCENYLQIKEFEEKKITELWEFEDRVDELFYYGKLQGHYFNQDLKPRAGSISAYTVNILEISKKAMYDFFHKGYEGNIKAMLDKVTMQLIKDKFIGKDYLSIKEVTQALNFRFNLLNYFKIEGKMDMGDRVVSLKGTLRQRLQQEDVGLCTDDEFYFAAGQITSYLVGRTQAAKPKQDLYEKYMHCNNASRLKDRIIADYNVYKYDIALKYKKFNKLFSAVMGYDTASKIQMDLFLAGLTASNILLEKKEEE